MEMFMTPLALFIIASICAGLLAVALPFALWYYFRAKEIAPYLVKKAELEAKLERLQGEIADAKSDLEKLAAAVAESNDLVVQGDLAKKWLEENQKKIEDVRAQVTAMNGEYELAKQQLDDMKGKVSNKQTELGELNAKLQACEEKLATIEKEKREIVEKLEARQSELKQTISQFESEKAALQSEKNALTTRVAELKDEREELKKSVAELEKETKDKAEALKDLVTKKTAEIEEELSKRCKAFENEVAARRKELEQEFQTRRDAFANDLAKQTKQLEEMRARQLDELGKEIDALKKQRDAMASEVAEYQVLKEKNESLHAENSGLEAQLKELKQKIADGESIIAKANTIRNSEANMWNDLERRVAIIEEEPASASAVSDQEKALQQFKDALDASGYMFSERTIKAFHTGLLCGGVSPLVVLSGISGTGKSLLPELYAKAFNMNFLPVAVQPRWDGPQDVFGFYNHMEGRFKATELSRLLWQFDVYNNPAARETYGEDLGQFPMSLVLLDEMNLARVEYYFSELLSKLEIRNRVVDPRDADARIPSEIELEYGASSVAGASASHNDRRLFVGRNILFVGTMNEDESTQTLSSKVIDRSNVIRFGTPESLKKAPNLKEFEKYCKNFVSFGTWRNWTKPYSQDLVGIDEKIKQLKDALKLVDRGFGHRTENAVKKYVSFYPGRKEDALADQIEMKILPKLNGVETDIVRDKVRPTIEQVLQSIGDKDVQEALDETLNSESTFFAWKGVRR
jgi:predicted  nucleic acid-binding Zn-ribbon protein